MTELRFEILIVMILISILGAVGNIILVLSIFHHHSRPKTFEVFLLGLAFSNLEEIFIVDLYDIILVRSVSHLNMWTCRTLKFLMAFGEVASILFTVLISVFRYQKLRHADTRVHIFLDNSRSACAVSGFCVGLALILSSPMYVLNLDQHLDANNTFNGTRCQPDFFQCVKGSCPITNHLYKYIFICLCIVLPFVIISVTGCLMVKFLLGQRTLILQEVPGQPTSHHVKDPKLQRSTAAVLTAMGLFQLDWAFYIVLHLAISPYEFPFWSEINFFIIISYTTMSPYVYGIGNHLFSLKDLSKH